jgi:hypothetical protein
MDARPLVLVLMAGVALAGAACGGPLLVQSDTSMSGRRVASSFYVERGRTVTVPAELHITVQGDISVQGDLLAPDGSGASITLVSTAGSVVIGGRIQAGKGAEGVHVGGVPEAVAGPGGAGGAVVIEARAGRVEIAGRLIGGTGGPGGRANASNGTPLTRAVSGAGGAGGPVRVSAARTIELQAGAEIEAGAGGDGGTARAFAYVAERATRVVEAHALGGGPGGDVELRVPTAPGALILGIGVAVRSGRGGNTLKAEVHNDGTSALAVADAGGPGGSVRLFAGDSARIRVTPVELGRGGHSGTAPATVQADAFAVRNATARVLGGGPPGARYEDGFKITDGAGGDSGRAAASLPSCAQRTEDGSRGAQGVAGRPATAACP